MTQPSKISRRDWFRLRVPRQNRALGEATPAPASPDSNSTPPSALTAISHPPNHDGMDLSQLPPMREAILTVEQIESLFQDIEHLASDVQLMQRSTGSQRARASVVSPAVANDQLQLAKTALLTNQIPRLQIRYRWENALWIDTLAVQEDGYRLVRISHQG